MTNRYRAGQPADLSFPRCPAASAGCNGPKEGECMGLCDMPVQFAGDEPQEGPSSYLIFLNKEPPLTARLMDAAADALDWLLDRLWVAAGVLVVGVVAIAWSMS